VWDAVGLVIAGLQLFFALIVGLTDTLGKSLMPDFMRLFLDPSSARQTGAALASMLVYIAMAAILAFRPRGLFPARSG
jgi:branched-chain amino acid transport system permease protein